MRFQRLRRQSARTRIGASFGRLFLLHQQPQGGKSPASGDNAKFAVGLAAFADFRRDGQRMQQAMRGNGSGKLLKADLAPGFADVHSRRLELVQGESISD